MSIILIAIFVAAAIFGAVRLDSDELTISELTRRSKRSEVYAKRLKRQQLLPSLVSIMHLGVGVFLIAFIVTASVWQGWLVGFAISAVAAILFPVVIRSSGAARLSGYLYNKTEPYLMTAAEKLSILWKFIGGHTPRQLSVTPQLSSREELLDIVKTSNNVLTQEEKRLVESAVSFSDKKVSDVMTPRAVIKSIKKDEFVGPLVLDELHSLGHGRLPVVDEDIDHVVGVLNLRSLLSLDVRKSATAGELMDKKAFFINKKDSLQKALSGFVKQRSHLFIVVNDNRETVGLITLEDVIEALIGRSIVDEDDVHEDMRAAAKEKSKGNNSGPNSTYL